MFLKMPRLRKIAKEYGYEIKRGPKRGYGNEYGYILIDLKGGRCVGLEGYRLSKDDVTGILWQIERADRLPFEKRLFPQYKQIIGKDPELEEVVERLKDFYKGDLKPWW